MSRSQKLSKLLCDELRMEIVLHLPQSFRQRIAEVCKQIIQNPSNNGKDWKARAYLYFLMNYSVYKLENIGHNHSHCDPRAISILLTGYTRGKPFLVRHQLDLKNELAYVKSGIDRFIDGDKGREDYYAKVTNILDQFADYRKRLKRKLNMPYLTNAFLKCWEMIQHFDLIPYRHSDTYRVFCNAEFPGAFIFAINHYMATRTDNPRFQWYGNSLWPGSDGKGDILSDEFGLYRKYPEKWLMDGKKHTGDVTKVEQINYIYEKIGESVDLYTSDIGIGLDVTNFNEQEELETPLNVGQIVSGLVSLRKGGNLVCKMFMFFTPFNISLLSALTGVFDEFYISKPVTSRPGNSEIYIIGKGYKGYAPSKTTIDKLIYSLQTSSYDEPMDAVSEEFYQRIVIASYIIYQRQMRYVDMSVKIAEYLYSYNLNPTFTYMTVDRNVVPGTGVELAEEIRHRQSIVSDWKKRYKDYLLERPISTPLINTGKR